MIKRNERSRSPECAGFDYMLGSAHRMGRVGRDDLSGDQPVEQHADGGQVLLDRRLLEIFRPAPRYRRRRAAARCRRAGRCWWCSHQAKNRPDRMQVGHAGVLVADGGGEEFQEAARRLVAGVGDDRRHDDRCRGGRGDPGALAAATTVSWRVWIRWGSSAMGLV